MSGEAVARSFASAIVRLPPRCPLSLSAHLTDESWAGAVLLMQEDILNEADVSRGTAS